MLGQLTVKLISGTDLAPKDKNGKSDPYCMIWVGDENEIKANKRKSKVKKNTLNPIWKNQVFTFTANSEDILRIRVWDHDTFSKDDFMGQLVLPIDGYFGDYEECKEARLIEMELQNDANIKTKISGSLTVEIAFKPNPWKKLANMNFKRYNHKLVNIDEENIIAIGGNTEIHTEIYNSVTNTWDFGPSLQVPRMSGHTVNTLPDNRIIVIGGVSGVGPTQQQVQATCEMLDLNDINTGWTTIADMNQNRESHAATVLPNGDILVTGGIGSDKMSLNTAEIYRSDIGVWEVLGKLPDDFPRFGHGSYLLDDGRVLLLGGSYTREIDGALKSTAIYCPEEGNFQVGPIAPIFSTRSTSVQLEGKIILFPGSNWYHDRDNSSTKYENKLIVFYQNQNEFKIAATSPAVGTAIVHGNAIYHIGGMVKKRLQKRTLIIQNTLIPDTPNFDRYIFPENGPTCPFDLYRPSVAAMNGVIHVVGGVENKDAMEHSNVHWGLLSYVI
eukprot:TRINITY_DN10635_c0_g1_i1.p1 TRINITY_DN10635_c0_g1~~TRINITY_DN10635_c0_g1_i1.p1  ORF type:complete len:499 (+),score=108.55 TRINITY_DN10635_c0_g1_i1:49-1545(+)